MWNLIKDFWSFNNPNVLWVVCGSIMLGFTAGVVGTFSFVRKRALVGDALAHAALPGVTTAFILFQTRDPWIIFLGAIISCAIGFYSVEYLVSKTKIKEDSALAIVLSLFFAMGMFQLSYIQKLPIASQAGLDKLLFGQASALVVDDLKTLAFVSVALLVLVILFFEKFRMISFDLNFAKSIGVNIRFYEFLLAVAIVCTVAVGLQLVGVVLMAAMVLTPAAASRFWTNNLKSMLVLSGIFGAISGVAGANLSYLRPGMPTGPLMVVVISFIFAISLIFAPNKGMIPKLKRIRFLRLKISGENILRSSFKYLENLSDHLTPVPLQIITDSRQMSSSEINKSLKHLTDLGLVSKVGANIILTEKGYARGHNLTRFHRLWELYLTEKINLPSDHVHEDAEEIEHILNSELAERISQELGEAKSDPHGKDIPDYNAKGKK